ncbi:protein CURLY FLAG LEAF 2-like [Aristolochia californica]|uniref:protein CURLY FLAG LEAF 2-like n=1 Tax=Aristolochia californica TaxID=171875 RepID=UPI0035DAFBF6
MASLQVEQQQHRTGGGVTPPAPLGQSVFCGSTIAGLRRAVPPFTLHLFHSGLDSSVVELDEPSPLPLGCQKFLNLETGSIYYEGEEEKMSRNGKNPKLELKLNLSPPDRSRRGTESPKGSSSSSSSPSSCVSSEAENSPEAGSMVLAGCPRCLMYVMLSHKDPKCPKCKSSVLLDFLQENNNYYSKRSKGSKS